MNQRINQRINHKRVFNLLRLKITKSISNSKQVHIATIRSTFTRRQTFQITSVVILQEQLKYKALNILSLLQILASTVIERDMAISTGLLDTVRLARKLLILKKDKKLQLKRFISILCLGCSELLIGVRHLSMKCS